MFLVLIANLFIKREFPIGRSKEFFELLRDLAEDGDEASRKCHWGQRFFTGAAPWVRRLSSRIFRSQALQLTFQRSRIQCELRP